MVAVYKLCCVCRGFLKFQSDSHSEPSFISPPILAESCTGVLRGKKTKGFKHPSEGMTKFVLSSRCFPVTAETRVRWKRTATDGQRTTSTPKAKPELFHSANIQKKREALSLPYSCLSSPSFYWILCVSGSMIKSMSVMLVDSPGKVAMFSKGLTKCFSSSLQRVCVPLVSPPLLPTSSLMVCSPIQDLPVRGVCYGYHGARFSHKSEKVLCRQGLPLVWYHTILATQGAPLQGSLFLPACVFNNRGQASWVSRLLQQLETSSGLYTALIALNFIPNSSTMMCQRCMMEIWSGLSERHFLA